VREDNQLLAARWREVCDPVDERRHIATACLIETWIDDTRVPYLASSHAIGHDCRLHHELPPLDACSDAIVQMAIYDNQAGSIRMGLFLTGATLLLGYGSFLNPSLCALTYRRLPLVLGK
jgi:hypothetical protein